MIAAHLSLDSSSAGARVTPQCSRSIRYAEA